MGRSHPHPQVIPRYLLTKFVQNAYKKLFSFVLYGRRAFADSIFTDIAFKTLSLSVAHLHKAPVVTIEETENISATLTLLDGRRVLAMRNMVWGPAKPFSTSIAFQALVSRLLPSTSTSGTESMTPGSLT